MAAVSFSDLIGSGDELTQRVVQHCAEVFAKYELPDEVLVWAELPLTATGKLDKKNVRAKLEEEGSPTSKFSELRGSMGSNGACL